MVKERILSFSGAVLVACTVMAQYTWRMAYGAFGPEEGRSVCVASDGDFVVAGSTGSFGAGTSDIYLVKIDGQGGVVWTRTIGGAMIEQANDLVRMDDGGWMVVGTTNDPGGGGGYDGLLVRTDADGNELWRRTYGGDGWDFLRRGWLMTDQALLMVGQTFSQGEGGDVWLIKVDQMGDTLWTRHYGGPETEDGASVTIGPDGRIVIAGSVALEGGDVDAQVLKLDDQLAVQWVHQYGGDSLDLARDVVATSDSGYSIVGATRSFSAWDEHYHFKVDAFGNLEWQKHWGQVNDQEAFRHLEMPSGDLVTTGWTKTSGGGGKDMFIFFSTSQGEFLAQHTFGGGQDEMGYGMARSADGFVACGVTGSYGYGGNDVFVVRTDSAGTTMTEDVGTFYDPLWIGQVDMDHPWAPYPNPSTGLVNIPSPGKYRSMEVWNAQGVLLERLDEVGPVVDLSHMGAGLFFFWLVQVDGTRQAYPVVMNPNLR